MADGTFVYDLVCRQGATLTCMFTFTNDSDVAYDLTDFHGKLQVRKTSSAPQALLELGDVAPLTGLTINGSLGKVALDVDEAITATLPAGTWVYDLMLTDPVDNVTPVMAGKFVVEPGVTR